MTDMQTRLQNEKSRVCRDREVKKKKKKKEMRETFMHVNTNLYTNSLTHQHKMLTLPKRALKRHH